MMALPNWIIPTKGRPNAFFVDPDLVYPALMKELGIEKPDRYWLGVMLGCMKHDFDIEVRRAKAIVPGRSIKRTLRPDDGRKLRWNRTMHGMGRVPKIEGIPVAKDAAGKVIVDFDQLPVNIRAAHIRHHYTRIRGFYPAG